MDEDEAYVKDIKYTRELFHIMRKHTKGRNKYRWNFTPENALKLRDELKKHDYDVAVVNV